MGERIKELEGNYKICKHSLEQLKHDLIAKNARIKKLESLMPLYDELLIRCAIAEKELATLRQRIADAPVVSLSATKGPLINKEDLYK